MHIQGNTFIVTGGASGLGEAVVKELHKAGANVAIFDLNDDAARELGQSLGDRVLVPGKVDVTSEEIVQDALKQTVARFGKIAGVINCGGVATAAKIARRGKSSHTLTMDLFEFTVRVNLVGTFNVCRQVAQIMANQDPFNEDETNMTSVMGEAARAKIIRDAVFPERMGQPQEFAALASHIIENRMLNGEIIRIDCGSRLGKL
ncbi:Dehydrogenase [Apophysomyces ossiformis]|uniref:Dehydrogenase n=1 Tax=Apophysomyces ossiformis TaxID=679940 RepID=A0A8H7BSM5_9FUNG|nr:Dehydrogenase [Apophysomyces ossiformis]